METKNEGHKFVLEVNKAKPNVYERHHKKVDLSKGTLQSKLDNPDTLDFLDIEITKALNKSSSVGLVGLSNLGNTCFMNSSL